jgi:AcrR family transcriptional regulator
VKSNVTKQLILDHALKLFTYKGYEGASMDDIARAVGIRKASLYAHFDGKESIFSAIFDDILAEYERFIHGLTRLSDETAQQALERVFVSFIDYCYDNPKMYFWDRYFYYPPAFLRDYIREKTLETERLFLARIRRLMEQGAGNGEIRGGDTEGMTLSYYYLMIGLSMSVRMYERADLLQDARAAWNGLRIGLENGGGEDQRA